MSFWIPPLWFAREAGGIVRSLFRDGDIQVPVHTRVIEVLEEQLEGVPVWADQSGSPREEENVVVMNAGGDWNVAANSKQRRSRNINLYAFATTSDAAERLIDRVAIVLRRSENLLLSSASDIAGGYIEDGDLYFRGISAVLRARL